MKKKIYLAEDIHPEARKKLEDYGEIIDNFDDIGSLDAIFLRANHLSRQQIAKAKNCKVIARHGVGMDILDLDACKEYNIPIVYTPTANSYSVAEFAFTLALSLMRNIYKTEYIMKTKGFNVLGPVELRGREMQNATIGIVGLGRVGSILAHMYKGAFNCRILGVDPRKSKEDLDKIHVEKIENLKDLVKYSDVVSICCPLNKQTLGIFNTNLFENFKKDSILINTARGAIVNEKDLYSALKSGRIYAAASDVFIDEFSAFENPLNKLENFIGFPHCAANTYESMYNMAMIAVDGLIDVLEGREPKYLFKY